MSNGNGGYVLIDINPLAGPDENVQDNDTITSKYAFEIHQKIMTGVMPVCANFGTDGLGITLAADTSGFNMCSFQMPIVQKLPDGAVCLIFTGIKEPIDAETCLATITITPSAEVDENGNPLEEATGVWKIYANAQ